MAYYFDKPDYRLTEIDKNELRSNFLELSQDNKDVFDGIFQVEIERSEGIITATCENGVIYPAFVWLDRDGDEDYFELENFELEAA